MMGVRAFPAASSGYPDWRPAYGSPRADRTWPPSPAEWKTGLSAPVVPVSASDSPVRFPQHIHVARSQCIVQKRQTLFGDFIRVTGIKTKGNPETLRSRRRIARARRYSVSFVQTIMTLETSDILSSTLSRSGYNSSQVMWQWLSVYMQFLRNRTVCFRHDTHKRICLTTICRSP